MEKSSINASNVDSSQIHILSPPPRHIKGVDSKDFLSLPIPKKSAVVSPVTSDNTPAQSDFQVEVQDLLRVDKNSRTVLHRAALDQNVTVVKQLCERAQKVGIKDYVNKLDKFGNTSLMSACVENTSHLYSDKLECVKILLQYGADPNICNVNTLWTPLTWCAYYADAETTRELLNQGACPYYFDCLGYFPLDLCGLQV